MGSLDTRFRDLQLKKSGGQALIYRATHADSGRRVAVKVWKTSTREGTGASLPGDAEQRARGEVLLLQRLGGHGVPMLIDSWLAHAGDDGPCWIAMEWVEGETLASRIPAPEIEWLRTVECLAAVADTLHRIHQDHGWVHGDLSPGNILVLEEGGAPVLVDFGLSRPTASREVALTYTTVGTLAYVDPEIVHGAGRNHPWTDIYALGRILEESLGTRTRPPPGPDRGEALPPGSSRPGPEAGRRLSRFGAASIVARATAPRPARYSSASELGDDLRRLRDGRVPRAVFWRMRRLLPRSAVVWVFGAVSLLLIGFGCQRILDWYRDPVRKADAFVDGLVRRPMEVRGEFQIPGGDLVLAPVLVDSWLLREAPRPPVADDEARKQLREANEALRTNDRDQDARVRKAGALYRMGEWGNAAREFKLAIDAAPSDPSLWTYMANAHRNSGEVTEAVRAFEVGRLLCREESERRRAVALGALALVDYGELSLAEQRLRGVLAEDPSDADGHKYLAMALLYRGDFEESARQASLVLYPSTPVDGEAMHTRSLARLAVGKVDEALAGMESAVGSAPEYWLGWNGLGVAQCAASRWTDAERSFARAVSGYPNLVYALTNRAVALRRLGRLPEAVESAGLALRVAPTLAHAYLARADAHRDAGSVEAARADYRDAVRFATTRLVRERAESGERALR